MKIIIIGGGAAAAEAAARIREIDKISQITLFSAEKVLPYRRPMLLKMLSPQFSPERIYIHQQSFYDKHRIEIKLNTPVTAIDWPEKCIYLADHTREYYDRLLIAVGSTVRTIPQSTGSKKNVTLHDLDDLSNLQVQIQRSSSCIIIGGGVSGLELAGELVSNNIRTTVIEGSEQLLNGVIDRQCADFLLEKILKNQLVNVLLKSRAEYLESSGDQIFCHLANKDIDIPIAGDMAVNTSGTLPRFLEWIPAVKSRRLEVDKYMRVKGFNDIFAAGDCAYYPGLRHGSYMTACKMGNIAGSNIAGFTEEISMEPIEFRSSFMQIKIYSAGETNDPELIPAVCQKENSLRKYYYRNNKLSGCTLINDLQDAGSLYEVITENRQCSQGKHCR